MPDPLSSKMRLSALEEKDREEDRAGPATGQHETKPIIIAIGAST
jgi:hypothetical protein